MFFHHHIPTNAILIYIYIISFFLILVTVGFSVVKYNTTCVYARKKKIQLEQKSGLFSYDREKEDVIAFANFSRINVRNTKQELLKKKTKNT